MNDPAPAQTVEQPADFGKDDAALAARWISELELAEKDQDSWAVRSRKIIKRYKNERKEEDKSRRFAVLWSNIQTLGPAVYARTPQATVGRRFKADDPIARVSSEVLERALEYSIDRYDFDAIILAARDEYLLIARGQVWVRYVPHFKTVQTPVTPLAPEVAGEGVEITDTVYADDAGQQHDPEDVQDDGKGGHYVEEEHLDYEEVRCDHVAWDNFLTNPARTWQEVRWVCRQAFLTREELVERFGEKKGEACPLDWGPEKDGADSAKDGQFKKARVYEIWDKASKKALWISKGLSEGPLDVRDDPLELDEFFPCPRPLLGTTAPDSIIPIPDYVYYQDQAEELDELTNRIAKLTSALRLNGFYAGEHGTALQNLFTEGQENKLIPIADWSALKDSGGAKGIIEWVPLEMVVAALKACYENRTHVLEDIYQITGVADILRGASDPNETATAQGIKAQWGSIRVRDRQKELSRFARDLIRIKGQIVASKFTTDTLKSMTGIELFDDDAAKQAATAQLQAQSPPPQPGQPLAQPQVPPELQRLLDAPTWEQVTKLLRDEALRCFRIDIETDSTIEPNEDEDKQRGVEFVTAFGGFIGAALPAVQAAPQLMPIIGETMKFLARKFRVAREMEDIIDKVAAQIGAAPPQPSPEQDPTKVAAEQAKTQATQIKAQAEQARAASDLQRTQIDAQTAQGDQQIKRGEQALQGQELALRARELHAQATAPQPTPAAPGGR